MIASNQEGTTCLSNNGDGCFDTTSDLVNNVTGQNENNCANDCGCIPVGSLLMQSNAHATAVEWASSDTLPIGSAATQVPPNDAIVERATEEPDYLERNGENHIWLHVYELDRITTWLNQTVLKKNECAAYHVGVEVYGKEWCFGYYTDVQDDPTVSGCRYDPPRGNTHFEITESLYMGRTSLSRAEVSCLLQRLWVEWTSMSYHLADRNCLHFAQCLVDELGVSRPFPERLLGFLGLTQRNSAVKWTLDTSWNVVQWWFTVKEKPKNEEEGTAQTKNEETTMSVFISAETTTNKGRGTEISY